MMEPYDEGRYAYFSDLSRDENPYDGIDAEEWDDGWCDAQEDDTTIVLRVTP